MAIYTPLTPQAVAILHHVSLFTAAWWVWLRLRVLTGDLRDDGEVVK